MFERPYKKRQIKDSEDLKTVFWYIANNPVKDKIVESPEKYEWGCFSLYAGYGWGHADIVDMEIIRGLFGTGNMAGRNIKMFCRTFCENKPDNLFQGKIDEMDFDNALLIIKEKMSTFYNTAPDNIKLSEHSISLFLSRISKKQKNELIVLILTNTGLPYRQIASLCQSSHTTVSTICACSKAREQAHQH